MTHQDAHPETQTFKFQAKALAGEAVMFIIFALIYLFILHPLRFGSYLWS
jgi:hypothetical protein